MSGEAARFSQIVVRFVIFAGAIVVFLLSSSVADAAQLAPGGTFVDDNNTVHEASIEAIASEGITVGCNPPANDRFCPRVPVTREQMASFLVRALDLPSGTSHFVDTADSIHSSDIAALAEAGIAKGCNPPVNDRYCPRDPVTREQMASFLVRALDLPAATVSFTDVDAGDPVHSSDIAALAEAGITKGCNPPDNDRFCPSATVTREQMASFLTRALDLDPIEPPDAPFHLISSFTTHHNCCEARVARVQDAADKIDGIVLLPGDTVSMLQVLNNRVYSGNCQTSTTLFNAVWYAGLDEIEHRPHSTDYSRYPQAIESTLIPGWVDLRFGNDTAYPLEIRSHYTGTSVTVELWGDNDGRSVVGDFTSTAGTVLDVVSEGGSEARVVDTETVADGRTYTVTRTITDSAGSESESWAWTYRY
ncbi:MAG: VanW family protein [Actinomycetota bacterium]|nr:VanW family protein [Actinomycetota bacterium]